MVIQVVIIGLAALVAGEALALTVGMSLSGDKGRTWLWGWNALWLFVDIAGGSAIAWAAWAGMLQSPVIWMLTGLLCLTHGWRAMEYSAGRRNAFCFNTALYQVNNLKLVSLLLLAIYLLWYGQQYSTFEPGRLV